MKAPTLEFRIYRGRIRPGLVVAVSLLALIAMLASGIGLPATAGMAALAAGTVWLDGRVRTRRVRMGPGKHIFLEQSAGTTLAGKLAGTPFVSPWFVGLGIQPLNGRRRQLGLFRDQLEPEAFRRLAARLRTGG